MKKMRSRTTFCEHGFLVPGLPEPWLKLELKASRFCLACWENHGQVFIANGYQHIGTEDSCENGFLDLIHYVLKDRAYYRDQDRFEFLEMELRMHLLEKRKRIEDLIASTPDKGKSYVRVVLNHKLQDLQQTPEFQIERFSDQIPDECDARGAESAARDFDPEDENQNAERIVDAVGDVPSARITVTEDGVERITVTSRKNVRDSAANSLIDSEYGGIVFSEANLAVRTLDDPRDPLTRTKQKTKKQQSQENAQLVAAAIEGQAHRVDALTTITRKEEYGQFFKALAKLPSDEQLVIRMRYVTPGVDEFRDCANAVADVVRELRNGNGPFLSEWDIRKLESQALLRLRSSKQKLPARLLKSRAA